MRDLHLPSNETVTEEGAIGGARYAQAIFQQLSRVLNQTSREKDKSTRLDRQMTRVRVLRGGRQAGLVMDRGRNRCPVGGRRAVDKLCLSFSVLFLPSSENVCRVVQRGLRGLPSLLPLRYKNEEDKKVCASFGVLANQGGKWIEQASIPDRTEVGFV